MREELSQSDMVGSSALCGVGIVDARRLIGTVLKWKNEIAFGAVCLSVIQSDAIADRRAAIQA